MKTKMKSAGLVIAAVVLVAVSILGTMAYLTDTAEVNNTFTVGKVDIKLDEVVPCEPEEGQECGRTETGNEYHLMPGGVYQKDPTVTVLEDSELSYVRIFMTINNQAALDGQFNQGLPPFFDGYDPAVWLYEGSVEVSDTRVYEFRYVNPTGPAVLTPLFTAVKISGDVTNEQLDALNELNIQLVAQAIQAEGFDDADAAWAAFPAPVIP